MKKLLCAITFVALFASCGQKEGPNSDDNLPSGDVKLEFYPLKPDSPAVHAEGGECTISFSINRNWKASADSWMTLSATSGKAGEVSLIVTTSENKGSKRIGEIVISTKDYSEKISFTQYPAIVSMEPRSKRNLKWDFSMSYSNNTFNNIYAQVSKPQTNMYQTVNASDMAGASTVVSENKLNETWFLRWDTPADGGVSRSIPFSVVFNTLHTDFSRIEGYEDYDTDSDLYKTYTGADVFQNQYYVNPSNANIKKQADKLWADAKGDIITFARKASTWTAENIPYTRMNTGLHPVQDILDNGGDCGNQASVFISLLRAKGIPARHVVLCRVGSAHVRAEFYLAGYGWIPADPNGEQSSPSLDWFGHVDNDADALVVSLGICNEYNIPAVGLFNCLLGQGLCGLWYNWRGETSYDLSFALVEFEPYLEDMGAAKERDDVFASVCYCPIIDLEHADMAYEWMYGNTDSRQGLPDEQKAVSEELAGQFPEYLASLELRKPDGSLLTEDNYLDYIREELIRAAQKAKDAGADIPPELGFSFSGISMGRFAAPIDGGRSARGFKTPQGGERQRLLETRVRPGMHVGEYILDLDMQSYLNYVVSTQPLKGVSAFDSKDVAGSRASGENDEFGDALGASVNYTLFSASKTGGVIDAELRKRVYLMNPMNFIGREGNAEHWYIRMGPVTVTLPFLFP